ncbi:MAG: conjugal transfer protein TraH [Candidatus Tectomicrobia bacterium]|uniref:Conjugal transfer protein TraH n=1 Tax=Tectimicrobiota bacterium TaxID=2528274 RepID=A0A933GJY5_UNCTE|nr:conjugal transfer protein TraH [Candidatus Tectomicrobia bacterium]
MVKTLTVTVISLGLLMLSPAFSGAGLQDEIDTMFQNFGFKAHGTEPGAYMAQSRGMIVGGSMNVRSSTSSINLFSVKPPEIKAGCGGLDMFFGGFSFVNAEEFQQMLQNIGQNAMGYAFELGLEAVCPTCNSVLKDLKNYASQLNKLRTDSCTAAKQLVAWAGESAAENTINSCVESLIAKDKSPDEARKQCLDGNQASSEVLAIRNQAKAEGRVSPVVEPGNTTWKALSYTDLSDDDKKIAMNLTGTYVRKLKDSNSSIVEWYGPRLTLRDVMYGKTGAEILIPDQSSDEEMTTETMDIEGFKPRVVEKINSIIPKLQAGAQTLSDEEKDFINAAHIPVRRLAEITQANQGMQNAAFDLLTDLIVADMAISTIMKYIHYVELNIGKQTIVDRDKVLDRIEAVKADLNTQLKRELDVVESASRSYEMTDFFDKQIKNVTGKQIGQAGKSGK